MKTYMREHRGMTILALLSVLLAAVYVFLYGPHLLDVPDQSIAIDGTEEVLRINGGAGIGEPRMLHHQEVDDAFIDLFDWNRWEKIRLPSDTLSDLRFAGPNGFMLKIEVLEGYGRYWDSADAVFAKNTYAPQKCARTVHYRVPVGTAQRIKDAYFIGTENE